MKFTHSHSSSTNCCGFALKMLSSTVIEPNVIFILPFLQLIKALVVARKGLPKMIGILALGCKVGSISKMINQQNNRNSQPLPVHPQPLPSASL